jgi:hypothetical protein
MPIYSRMQKFIKHKSRNKTYISDEQLHSMELYIYHAIKIQVDGVEVNAYLGYMDALLAKTGADGFDGITS